MKTRGKVLRDASSGSGLLIVDGQQYPFSTEGLWRSAVPPRAGQDVEVELDEQMHLTAITPASQPSVSPTHSDTATALAAKEKGLQVVRALTAKFGASTLIGLLLLLAGWFFFTTLSIAVPFSASIKLSFWQVLGLVNASNPLAAMDPGASLSAGIYGLLAVIALAGPLVPYFWKDKRASLAGTAPLVLMILVWILARHSIQNAFVPAAAGPFAEAAKEIGSEAMSAVSFGFGAWFSALVAAWFAFRGIRQFLAMRSQAR
jgi:hypothetical protein